MDGVMKVLPQAFTAVVTGLVPVTPLRDAVRLGVIRGTALLSGIAGTSPAMTGEDEPGNDGAWD
jgi:hypothetical protein